MLARLVTWMFQFYSENRIRICYHKGDINNVAAIQGRERVSQPNTTQVYNLSSTFVTPDLDSFKASEYQIQQEQLEQLRKMNGRR